jgi:hypothetical protein
MAPGRDVDLGDAAEVGWGHLPDRGHQAIIGNSWYGAGVQRL